MKNLVYSSISTFLSPQPSTDGHKSASLTLFREIQPMQHNLYMVRVGSLMNLRSHHIVGIPVNLITLSAFRA